MTWPLVFYFLLRSSTFLHVVLEIVRISVTSLTLGAFVRLFFVSCAHFQGTFQLVMVINCFSTFFTLFTINCEFVFFKDTWCNEYLTTSIARILVRNTDYKELWEIFIGYIYLSTLCLVQSMKSNFTSVYSMPWPSAEPSISHVYKWFRIVHSNQYM